MSYFKVDLRTTNAFKIDHLVIRAKRNKSELAIPFLPIL